MGFFSKLFKGPEVDQAKSDANRKRCGGFLTRWWKTGTTIG